VVGVIGGGQLARMTQQAAIALGVRLRVLAEAADNSAAQVTPDCLVGDYRDLATVREFCRGVDVLTFDHEHVPKAVLRALEADAVVCRPGSAAITHAQDKAEMRRRLTALDVPCPRHRVVATAGDVSGFANEVGWPVVVKTSRGGYDGKGVWLAESAGDTGLEGGPRTGLDGEPVTEYVAEERLDFRRELAVVVARAPSGQTAVYPVVESVQRDGVCVEVVAPAPGLSDELALRAQRLALRIAGELDVVGVLAVELFQTADDRLLVNELAMRPHNTGHWSIDGAVTSQFENHLRAVLDLPLGSPLARQPWAVMVNVLGGEVSALHDGLPHVFARDPSLRVHLYGKDVKPGRKVGHVTAYGAGLADVRERARHAAAWLRGDLPDGEGEP
jgi:5-(carboxyamino)imidazole ribonucleotide synthase